jgi:carbon monoxide dehydrogenase subunit G
VITFETSVRVERPIEDVFDFVSDPTRFPIWNSAVHAVHRTSGEAGRLGSTYSMERDLPIGQVENGLEVFAREHPSVFGIRTTSGPTPFVYRYRFACDGADTVVHLDASVELPGAAAVLGRLARSGEAWMRTSPLSSARSRRGRETHNPRPTKRGANHDHTDCNRAKHADSIATPEAAHRAGRGGASALPWRG